MREQSWTFFLARVSAKIPISIRKLEPPIKYVPELDGLRAFAIFGVLAIHSNFALQTPWLEQVRGWGWAGVDLFFVVSGFLITSILLSARSKPHYYRNFYARRGLRIWPLYYLLLFYVFVLTPHLGKWADQHIDFSVYKWQYYVCYMQNLVFTRLGSFALVITWSLCIEEQFYLVWPFFVRLFSRRSLEYLLIAVLISQPLLRLYLHRENASMGFFFTFDRLDAIAAGALVALRPKWFRFAWLATPLAIYLLKVGEWDFMYLALAITFAGIVCLATSHRSRVLASWPLRSMGKISYGIYIFHPLVFTLYWYTPIHKLFMHFHLPPVFDFWAQVLLPIPVAALSWKYFEKPILSLKRHFEVRTPESARAPQRERVLEPAVQTGD
jgi:peptidoglycan/LPS O-acetylase OafA/YrhL